MDQFNRGLYTGEGHSAVKTATVAIHRAEDAKRGAAQISVLSVAMAMPLELGEHPEQKGLISPFPCPKPRCSSATLHRRTDRIWPCSRLQSLCAGQNPSTASREQLALTTAPGPSPPLSSSGLQVQASAAHAASNQQHLQPCPVPTLCIPSSAQCTGSCCRGLNRGHGVILLAVNYLCAGAWGFRVMATGREYSGSPLLAREKHNPALQTNS